SGGATGGCGGGAEGYEGVSGGRCVYGELRGGLRCRVGVRVLGGIVPERRDGWDGSSYMRTSEDGRQARPFFLLARSRCAATEEVDIPARVVGHGTLDKRRLAC